MNTPRNRTARVSGYLSAALGVAAFCACSSDSGSQTPDTSDSDATADVADDTASTDTSDDGGADASTDTVDDAVEDTAADTGEDVAEDAAEDTGETIACGNDSPEALAACITPDPWFAIVEDIAQPRPTGSPAWQHAQDVCVTTLTDAGFDVVLDDYGSGVNVIGTLTGTSSPDEIVLVSAHYDHIPNVNTDAVPCPGADDNASGVASALELARVLGTTEHARTLVVACWDEEERGLIGSRDWAERATRDGQNILVNFTLEMVGYFTDEPNTQEFPAGFELFFAEASAAVEARDRRGDFLALVGDESAAVYMDALVEWSARTDVEHLKVQVPSDLTQAVALSDLRRSDHAPFWDHGVPSVMLTDSSEFRNPNYHCPAGFIDSPDTLNPTAAAEALKTVVAVTAQVLADTTPLTVVAVPSECDPLNDTCPEGSDCAYTVSGAASGISLCTPTIGDVGEGEICARTSDGAGYDDCAPGLFCANYGVPLAADGTFVRECRRWCATAADCGGDQICRRIGGYEGAGVCVDICDPFNSTCREGHVCSQTHRFDAMTWGWSCNFSPTDISQGAACSLPESCGNQSVCAPSTATCEPACSDDVPCADGFVCEQWIVPPFIEGFGACVAE